MVLDLGSKVNDAIVLAMALLTGGALVLSGPAAYWDWPWVKQESPEIEFLVAAACTALGLWFLWIAAAHACRLFNPAPDAVIEEAGITLKRCMAPRPFVWSEIASSRVKREIGYRGQVLWVLELELAEPIRSLTSPWLPGHTIRLVGRSAAPIKQAGRIVRCYRLAAGLER